MTSLARALSEALLQFVWQGFVAAFFLQVLLRTCRSASPRIRYAVSCCGLAVLALLPVITAVAMYDPLERIQAGNAAFTLTITAALPATLSLSRLPFAEWITKSANDLQSALQLWILPAWLIGVAYFALRLTWTGGRISLLRRSCTQPDAVLLASVANLAHRMGVKRKIRVLICPLAGGPGVAGWFRPAILLSFSTILNLSPEQLECIIAHELAHLRRHDEIVNILQTFVETLLFYHPAVWWVSRRIRHERELCCDDAAVVACGDAVLYARALTTLEKLRAAFSALALGATDGSLSYRIRRITGTRTADDMPSSLPGVVALGIILLCMGVYSNPAHGAAGSAHRGHPEYPESARTRGIQGTVPLEMNVDGQGNVSAVRALGGPKELRDAAIAFASDLHFTPGARSGLTQINTVFQLMAGQGADFAGHVSEDSSGTSLAQAELKVRKAGMRELIADLETDRSGRFAATNIPAGDYTIEALKPNFITATFPVHLPNTDLQLRLVRYGVIDGKVTNTAGEPIPARLLNRGGSTSGAARIQLFAKKPGSNDFRPLRYIPLEDGGHYRFFDLQPGEYELAVWYYGLNEGSGMRFYPNDSAPKIFAVAGGENYENANFSISALPQSAITGKVESADAKLHFALALGLPDQPALPIAQTTTEDDGSFRFSKVPIGKYNLYVSGPLGGYTAFESILRPGDAFFAKVSLVVSGPEVKDLSISVSPAKSFQVILHPYGTDAPPPSCPKSTTVSIEALDPWGILFSAGGAAAAVFDTPQSVKNLAPGRFRLTARDLGPACYQVHETEVDLSTDLSKDVQRPVEIEVAAAGSIRGTLRMAEGTNNNVIVLVNDSNSGEAKTQLAFADLQGHFHFDELRPGHYRIAAQLAGQRWLTDMEQMTQVEVQGGKTIDVEIAATKAGQQ